MNVICSFFKRVSAISLSVEMLNRFRFCVCVFALHRWIAVAAADLLSEIRNGGGTCSEPSQSGSMQRGLEGHWLWPCVRDGYKQLYIVFSSSKIIKFVYVSNFKCCTILYKMYRSSTSVPQQISKVYIFCIIHNILKAIIQFTH